MPSSASAFSWTVCLVGGVMSALLLSGEKAAAQTPNQGGGLNMSLESSIVIEPEAPVEEQKKPAAIPHQSPEWQRMEQIEAQGGERADMSEALNKKLRVNPVIGGRRQAGNPRRPGDDVKRRLPFGLEFMREF
ncbi:MAG: hypothetical protein CMM59_03240 [Rhodospirillaceae bacterium]|nr:hypothetical protein [Rhodospirillaceae bacterium]